MRKLHHDVREVTLAELDESAARAKDDMAAWRAQGEHALAGICEAAMNRFLDARAARTRQGAVA